MSIVDSPNQLEATLKVTVETHGDISDAEGVAIAKSVCVGALEEAFDQAVVDEGLSPRLSRDAFAIYGPELERRFTLKALERGSLIVAIGIDEATVVWIVQQLWPGLADSAIVALAALAFHYLRRGGPVARKVVSRAKFPTPPASRIVRVDLEYEDGTKVSWDIRRLRTTESKAGARQLTRVGYVTRPRRRGRRGKTKG